MAVKEEEKAAVSDERQKALKLAIDKIEKDFGKGAIMKLGDNQKINVELLPTGALSLDLALAVVIQKVALLRFMAQNLLVKLPWLFMRLLRFRSRVARLHLSMQSMRLIHPTHVKLVLILQICLFPSQTTASRRSKFVKPSFAPAQSILS